MSNSILKRLKTLSNFKFSISLIAKKTTNLSLADAEAAKIELVSWYKERINLKSEDGLKFQEIIDKSTIDKKNKIIFIELDDPNFNIISLYPLYEEFEIRISFKQQDN